MILNTDLFHSFWKQIDDKEDIFDLLINTVE